MSHDHAIRAAGLEQERRRDVWPSAVIDGERFYDETSERAQRSPIDGASLGEQKLADENYRAALKLAPKNPDVANSYGGYLCRTGEREKGLEYFRQAGENALYRTPEVAFTNAAVCALGIPDLKTAERFLRRALEANPTFREALLRLSVLSLDTDRPLQARAFLERFHSAGPATIDSLSLGVRIESALG